jgi:predicted site-specific integrase-resolvase
VEPSFRRRNRDPDLWYYRLKEIAELTGVCWRTVRNWTRAGLPFTRAPGGRVMLVLGRDLNYFLRSTKRVYPRER